MKEQKTKKCKDCGKILSLNKYTYCDLCSKKGKRNPNFKHGETLKQHFCKECNKEISLNTALYGSGLCRKCAQKKRFKDPKKQPMLGKKHSKKAKKKMSKSKATHGRSLKPNYCIDCGVEIDWMAKRCRICSNTKENHPSWKDGISPLNLLIRSCEAYKNWRTQVFEKDNYTCQKCGQRGCKLEAHHSKSFSKILSEFLEFHYNLDPVNDKYKLVDLSKQWKEFWDLENGITLCKVCHKQLHKNFKKPASRK